ncbi:MAG TPA: alpha/beta hydrolase [Streptosporangiaceae bacterium]|jgi:pimeloyl-ACP methyl ester carboxylesterase
MSRERQQDHPDAVQDIYRRMTRAAGAETRYLTRPSGSRVHVIECGDGPPMVHLHGTLTSALSHLMIAERMPGVRSYLVDRTGCGLSDPETYPRSGYRAHALGFMNDVLDGLGVDETVLAGASGGGIWATWYALARPERVRGLVLLGSVPTFPGGRAPLPLRLMATPVIGSVMRMKKPDRAMMLRIMETMGEGGSFCNHPDLLESLVAGAHDPVAEAANVAELRAILNLAGIRGTMRIDPQALRGLTVPTLMIWGVRDPVVPVTQARVVADLIPQSRLEELDAGHVPQLRHPDAVASLMGAFAGIATRRGPAARSGPGTA